MTITFGPQDNANFAQAQWSLLGQAVEKNGVVTGGLNALAPSVVTGLQVQAASGWAWVQGFFFQSDAAVAVTLAAADPSNPRLDRLVVHCDLSAHTASIIALTGTPGASPAPPALTQTATVWEISVAQFRVNAAATTATLAVDERTFCGPQRRVAADPTSTATLPLSIIVIGASDALPAAGTKGRILFKLPFNLP